MDNDFADVLNNFSEILKEKDIDLNKIIGGENDTPPDNNDSENSNDNFQFDINTILKIKDIINSLNNKNALKPYLQDTKKEKLEQYIKIANLLSVLDSFDDKNSFKFLNSDNYDFVLMLILFLLIF